MRSTFAGYMGEIRSRNAGSNKCKSEGGEKKRLCQLVKSSGDQLEVDPTQYWDKGDDLGGEYSGIDRYAKTICKRLEEWISTFSWRQGTEGLYLFEKCKYDPVKGIVTTQGKDTECKMQPGILHWDNLGDRGKLNMKQEYHVEYQICIDIVSTIAHVFGLKSTGSSVNMNQAKQENYCQQMYDKLTKWGGKDEAEGIMQQWFTIQPQEASRGKYFRLSGYDLFEMVTTLISQGGRTNKDLICRKENTVRGELQEQIISYHTQQSEDSQGITPPQEDHGGTPEVTGSGGGPRPRLTVGAGAGSPSMPSQPQQHSPSDSISRNDNEESLTSLSSGNSSDSSREETVGDDGAAGGVIGSTVGGLVASALAVGALYGIYRIRYQRRKLRNSLPRRGESTGVKYGRYQRD
ncbi:hypothetical protein C922_03594 [Plasmodium inui San Antonio 1]|uniref:Uncharacterized protein n=1 Tax=Plasmodium inui San Antonio 1 TaxID=1237626 RepID=W7AAM6_9APIC|nr:hypothetical protein C922_03594 [Plasmodium inui San Antonio 1]EUD66124.1 hypothetical protein C922_03594 [Plasmodium inui San Antonio 1]